MLPIPFLGAVFSVSISGSVVCSGGEDDIAFVWTTVDGSLLFECQGHKDSVTCTGFSYDGKYVCTADIGGLVQVRGIPTGELIWSTEVGDIEWVQWHSQALVLFAGTSDGGSWMWKIPSGECKTFPGANCRNTCGALLPDGKRLGCGYEDGSVKVWCLKEAKPLSSVVPPFSHSLPVTCVAVHQDNTLVMTGSEDSTAKVINSTNGKVLATLAVGFPKQTAELSGDEASVSEVASSVEAVGFSPVLPLAVTASLSGVLGVWDTSSWTLRHQCHHEAGIVRVHCSSCRPVVYTGSLDGGVRAWDLRAGQCVKEWLGHTDHILDLAVAGDDNILLSASNDNSVRLYSNQI